MAYIKFPSSPQSLDDTPDIPMVSPIIRKHGYSAFAYGYMPALLGVYRPVKKRERTKVDDSSTILSDTAVSTAAISVLSADHPVLQAFPAFRALHASLMKKERGYPIQKAKNIMEEILDKSPKLTRAMLRSKSKEYAAARHDTVELKLITGKEKLERIAEKEGELDVIIWRIVRCRTMRWTRRSVITYWRAWSTAFLPCMER
jgi:hypothetical protein